MQHALNLHQAVPDHGHGSAAVLQDAYGLDALVAVVAHEVGPHDGDAHHGQQPLDSFQVGQMRVLDVEASSFQAAVQSLNLPTQFVGVHGLLGSVVAD